MTKSKKINLKGGASGYGSGSRHITPTFKQKVHTIMMDHSKSPEQMTQKDITVWKGVVGAQRILLEKKEQQLKKKEQQLEAQRQQLEDQQQQLDTYESEALKLLKIIRKE